MIPAEGSSDPFWSDPSNEAPRMARIQAIVERQQDIDKIIFYVGKSNNDNFVAYRWESEKGIIDNFWISTQNVAEERRDTLNLAEQMVYGTTLRITPGGWIVKMNAEQLKSKVMNLVMDDKDNAKLVGPVNGKMCILSHAYVQMSQGLLPSVDWIRLTGHEVATGNAQSEVLDANERT